MRTAEYSFSEPRIRDWQNNVETFSRNLSCPSVHDCFSSGIPPPSSLRISSSFSHFSATDRRRCRRRHEPRVRALVIPFPFLRHTAAVVTLSALDNNEEWRAAASRLA